MKIERLSKLLNSFGSSSQSEQNAKTENVKAAADEAVELAPGFGKSAAVGDSSSDRSQRVAELKQQVASGTYAPDLRDVANSVARELFA